MAYRLSPDETAESYRRDLHDAGLDDEAVEKGVLGRHLLHDHDVLMSIDEYRDHTVESLRALDPCCGGDAA